MGSFSLLTLNIDANIDRLQNQNEVIAYVDETLSEDEARAIEPQVAAVPNVATVEFVTREQAMQTFEAEYDSDLFDNIDASVFRHRYVVTLDDLSLMKDTQAALKNVDGIADVTAHLDYAENFITFRNIVSVVSVVLIVILIAVPAAVGGLYFVLPAQDPSVKQVLILEDESVIVFRHVLFMTNFT